MATAPRVGIFGGAFDPPHLAHVALAQAAVDQLNLDVLRVIPTGQAWHKSRPLSAPAHRLAMARLAFEREARVVVDDRETRRTGPSYTIDTLREITASEPGVELFLLIGGDQARALPTWHEWQAMLQYATICIAERPETQRPGIVSESYPWLRDSFKRQFVALEMPSSSISATDIRRRVATNGDVTPLVGVEVARYIAHHHLYTSD